MATLNILVMGKSGSGKSSLMNYLIDKNLAEAGAGRPITKQGIYSYPPINHQGIDWVFNDTWGLEADKAKEWEEEILNNLQEKELTGNINNWYHCVVYCISAKGARIESFEIDNIIKPLIEYGTSVVIALTKADIASEGEKNNLKEVIYEKINKDIKIIEICSDAKQLRSKTTERFGRESMLNAMNENIYTNLIRKITGIFTQQSKKEFNAFKETLVDFFNEHKSIFKIKANPSIARQVDVISKIAIDNVFLSLENWLLYNISQAKLLFNSFGEEFNLKKIMTVERNFFYEKHQSTIGAVRIKRPVNVNFKGVDHIDRLNKEIDSFSSQLDNTVLTICNELEKNTQTSNVK